MLIYSDSSNSVETLPISLAKPSFKPGTQAHTKV
jgi:hypothetical protein